MRQINSELEKKGYIVIRGKVTRFETEEVQNHGHKQKELEIISRKIIRQVY